MQLPQEAVYALIAGAVGLVFAVVMAKKVMAQDRGNDEMKEIQDNIAVGAMTYWALNRRALPLPRSSGSTAMPTRATPTR